MLTPPQIAAIRFGFGLPPPPGAPGTPAGMLDLLSGPDLAIEAHPGPRLPETLNAIFGAAQARRALVRSPDDPGLAEARRETHRVLRVMTERGLRVSLARALDSPDGLRERLVRFWADHFTTRPKVAIDGPLPFTLAEEAIRPHLNGSFAQMLTAATLHPAMLVFLDQTSSIGPNSRLGQRRRRGLNENLARELIELHTLGVGAGYTQADVRELAELLTGLSVDPEQGTVFRADWAEPGAETVLGRSYGGEGVEPVLEVLADLAARPETARHIARKLAVHFVADEPDPGLVAAIEVRFLETGGDLPQVHAVLVEHPAAWAPDLAKVRQPFDLVAAGLRALGIGGAQVTDLSPRLLRQRILGAMAAMGQPWQTPQGPDGWPEAAEAWITPQLLAARIQWAMEAPGALLRRLPDPADFARRALGPLAEGPVLWAVERAETQAEAVGLVLASPAFNRR